MCRFRGILLCIVLLWKFNKVSNFLHWSIVKFKADFVSSTKDILKTMFFVQFCAINAAASSPALPAIRPARTSTRPSPINGATARRARRASGTRGRSRRTKSRRSGNASRPRSSSGRSLTRWRPSPVAKCRTSRRRQARALWPAFAIRTCATQRNQLEVITVKPIVH